MPPWVCLYLVEIVGRQGVGEDADDGVGLRGSRGVGNTEFEEGGRDARIVLVGRDEGVKGGQLHLAGKGIIEIRQLGQRIFSTEVNAFEMGQSGKILAARPPAKRVEFRREQVTLKGHLQIAVEDTGVGQSVIVLSTDGEVGEAVDAAFVGAVEDFPVDQTSVAGQPDTAAADATEGETDLAGLFIAVNEVVHLILPTYVVSVKTGLRPRLEVHYHL